MSSQALAGRERALALLLGDRALPHPRGIVSVCSAHPLVIEAALRDGQRRSADRPH